MQSFIIVLGMHRSGTSMLTNIIEQAGYYVGQKNDLIAAAADNEKGFFERVSVARANDLIFQFCGGSWDNPPVQDDINQISIDPLLKSLLKIYEEKDRVVLKDPRLCLTFPVWENVIPKNVKFVFINRKTDAVAASLMSRNKFSKAKSTYLYDVYNNQAERLLENFEHLRIQYEELFTEKREGILTELASFLGTKKNLIEIGDSIIDPGLNHYSLDDKRGLVSIIILTYNAQTFTQKCVESIQNHTNYPHEIIFVDNGSTDNTIEYLKQLTPEHSNYQLIENKTNRGFAAGNNQGVQAAQGKYVLLLNNDVLVGDGWLENMVSALELDEQIGLVGPITNHISGRQMVKNVPYQNDTEFYSYAQSVAKQNRNTITPRRRIAGFAMLMDKTLYQNVEGFDESFGSGNFEDDDLCMKVKAAGYAIMVHEGVFLHHYGSQTFIANKIDYSASLKSKGKLFCEKWPETNYDDLIESTNPLSEIHPNMYLAGIEQLEGAEYESAYQIMKQLLVENPLFEDALIGLALSAKALGKPEEAMTILHRLIKLNLQHAIAFNLMGLLAAETGEHESAKKLFLLAIKNDENLIEAHRNYAEILLMNDELQEGVQALYNIIEKYPDDIPTLMHLTNLNLEAGRLEGAKDYAVTVLKIDPENEYALEIMKNMVL